jgi:hypothetical protein
MVKETGRRSLKGLLLLGGVIAPTDSVVLSSSSFSSTVRPVLQDQLLHDPLKEACQVRKNARALKYLIFYRAIH